MLLKVHLPDRHAPGQRRAQGGAGDGRLVESLMGRKPELRFEYIQANAKMVRELDV